MDLMQRRRELMMMGGDNYLEGWLPDTSLGYNNPLNEIAAQGYITSPFFPIPNGCARVTVKIANNSPSNIRWYLCKDDKSHENGQSTKSLGAMNTKATDFYIRVVCVMADIDDCYVMDFTDNTYIWKGKNV